MDIIEKIKKLKEEHNAVIIAHHYAPTDVHEIADVLTDSLGFFESIKNGFSAQVIVVVAPSFFAEIAAALLPEKIILVPAKIECPVAMHRELSFEKISAFKALHPGIPLVCHAISPFQNKLLADIIAVSDEAVQTVQSLENDKVLFVGEKNYGEEFAKSSGKEVILYPHNPVCNVYDSVNMSDVEKLRTEYPDACLMVHPSCKPEVCAAADHVMGTGAMYNHYIKMDNTITTYILGTEVGFYLRMQKEFPEKKFIHLSPYLQCNVFKALRMETICHALENMKKMIKPDKAIAKRVAPLLFDIFKIGTESKYSLTLNEKDLHLLMESWQKEAPAIIMPTTSGIACQARFSNHSRENCIVLSLFDHREADFKPLSTCCITYSLESRAAFFVSTIQYYLKSENSEPAKVILNYPEKIFWSETRQSLRIPLINNSQFMVQVKIPQWYMTLDAHAIDISYGGIQISFPPDDPPDLPIGAQILVKLNYKENVADLKAEVRHHLHNRYGLFFLETNYNKGVHPPKSLETIVNLLQKEWIFKK
ncbi:MAG: quinolinate synthase NadA [bacterium]